MGKRLYTLEVFILEGPMTEDFIKKNPSVSRTIEIRGDQTLEQLHEAIFRALDRFDGHMYEFQFGAGPHDPEGERYVLPMALEPLFEGDPEPAGDVTQTTVDSLGLEVDQPFGYWFDFGDNWYHQINVLAIGEATPRARYPKVTERVGESPPQYVDWDEEDEECEEDAEQA
jgi:hypothetical protein